jgi:tRNA1(Val) A37 N6-methylase TrmN6
MTSEQSLQCIPGTRVDSLCGDFIIVQSASGQRYTTDDILVAWLAIKTIRESGRPVDRFIDLGSGLCSIPMIMLWSFPAVRGIGIELNPCRLALGARSLQANGLQARFSLIRGDLRNICLRTRAGMVTSSPPYHQRRSGLLSANSDKAAVRFELHGGIEDYVGAAAEHLMDNGFFITVYSCRHQERLLRAAETRGFSLDQQINVVTRQTKPPLFALFCFCRSAPGRNRRETLTIRNGDQSFTSEYQSVRQQIGFPPSR